jgi:hypothetical protein
MYKQRDKQINFDDFNQPLGLEVLRQGMGCLFVRVMPLTGQRL